MLKVEGQDVAIRRAPEVLPLALPPRGLNREQAAAYIGIGTTKFDQLVEDGRMPGPKAVDGRKIWDRKALDIAFDQLPDKTPDAGRWEPRV